MEKRLILAIILSVVILVAYQMLFVKTPPPPTAAPPAKTSSASAPAPAAKEPAVEAPAVTAETPLPGAPAATEPLAPEVPETRAVPQAVTIDTPHFTARLDNRGAVLRSLVLKKYHENGDGGVEIIPSVLPPEFGHFLSLYLPAQPDLEKELHQLLYEVRDETVTEGDRRFRRIGFHYRRTNLEVEKQLDFPADSPYLVGVRSRVVYRGRELTPMIQIGPGLTEHDLVPAEQYQTPPQIVYFDGGSTTTLDGPKVSDEKDGQQTIQGSIRWAGVQTKFFAALAMGAFPQIRATNRVWTQTGEGGATRTAHIVSVFFPAGADGGAIPIYLGPKSYEIMSSISGELSQAIDFGWFSIIVKPLYYSLRWLNQYVSNWGWCIVILTFFITLALFPIRFFQMKSMKQMQRIQPQMKAIQSKYKGSKSAEDRQKMNMEMMQLYKEHGVNPMSGCLPMVVQIPFLIAFYNLIDKSIEFWRQPFVFWLKDLSAPDPYWITPIVMGLTMIVQIKQTAATSPAPDSKVQQMMMTYMMPAMMTFFFLNMSSGLVVYFLFSNVFSWLMQKSVEQFIPSGDPDKDKKAKSKKKSANR
jgi:YidC/Oxa1 family membrane protein insertase